MNHGGLSASDRGRPFPAHQRRKLQCRSGRVRRDKCSSAETAPFLGRWLWCDASRVFERFDYRAYRAVVLAGIEARDRRFSHVGTESLLVGLLLEAEARTDSTSQAASAVVESVREVVGQRVGAGDESDPEARVIELTPRAREVLQRAEHEADQERAERVCPAHILLAISRVGVGEGLIALDSMQISPDDLYACLYG
jgi:hypothetical protein